MRALATVVAVVGVACGGTAPPETTPQAPREYPGTLAEPRELGPDLMMRQHLVAHYPERDPIEFDAVVQKVGNTLTVLVLSPWGGRAFLVEQTGQEVRHERFVDRDLPFPPRYMLLDVQRAFFLGVRDVSLHAETEPPPDGMHETERHDERVTERWQSGKLVERAYQRTDRDLPGAVLVTYEEGWAPGIPPPVTTLSNQWFGYRLDITTSDWRRL